ncbi:D-alanyl-D-alanine carboxypeptidase family protein [uncultured Cohaesibacter sp.]|uniref:D-alanyl-D-alanine carboxypeptidase family protein n=1 Tax=uncultured Cohaesibacter sp. TaxID=1002546 RepID=UPI0029C7AE97|nr:D-alanyl-D-alanine carboxypeptidase family protein [uncultured Cohaesibacter sp.]
MLVVSVLKDCRSLLEKTALKVGFLVLFAVLMASGAASAAQSAKAKQSAPQDLTLPPHPLLLMDVNTGNVLYHQKGNQKWYPASLTKLMTAYVTFKAIAAGEISEDSVVTISAHALSYPPSKMGFKVGTQLTMGNALKMMLVKSANDIAAAIGERVAGSEPDFARRMNQEAARLGMRASHFVNANGLYAQGQTSSARDMAVLARQILLEFPQYRSLFQIPSIRHGKRVLKSYNSLLETFRGANGMKTGFVCASGYNIVASAKRGNRQLVAVVMGAPSSQWRSETAAFLLTQGFTRSDMGSGSGTPVTNEAAFGPISRPDDMRSEICPNGQPKWIGQVNFTKSYLSPRFKIMDPVRVTAGIPKRAVKLPVQLASLPMVAPIEKSGLVAKTKAGKVVSLERLPLPKP